MGDKLDGQIFKAENNSIKPTLDILHSLFWDGPWRNDEKEM